MVNSLRKNSWIIIVLLCIVGGTIYYMVTGGPGFTMGTDTEKIGIVTGSQESNTSLFIYYDDMESVELIDTPESFGTAVSENAGHNTVYGTYKNDEYGTYDVYVYTKVEQCVKVVYKDGVLLVNDSNKSKTNTLFKTLSEKSGKGEE